MLAASGGSDVIIGACISGVAVVLAGVIAAINQRTNRERQQRTDVAVNKTDKVVAYLQTQVTSLVVSKDACEQKLAVALRRIDKLEQKGTA